MERLVAYSVGVVYASVCTDLTRRAAADRLNREHPTGLKHRWRVAREPYRTGETNPHPCERDQSRTHYLFSC